MSGGEESASPRGNLLFASVLILAFASTGLLVGWLVGVSGGSVATSLFPLIFGLLGAVSYRVVDSHLRADEIRKQVASVDENIKATVREVLLASNSDNRPQILWSLGVIVFCTTCYFGTRYGTESRNPSYTNKWVEKSSKLSPPDRVLIYRLAWGLRSSGVPSREAIPFLNDIASRGVETTTRQEIEKMLATLSSRDFNLSPMGASKAYLHALENSVASEILDAVESLEGISESDRIRLINLIQDAASK